MTTVVGGGLAGLAAANALALRGERVTLVEQSGHLGGRAYTTQEKGYQFNLGPHALYVAGIANRTLREWGIPFEGRPPANEGRSFFVDQGQPVPMLRTAASIVSARWLSTMEKLEAARALAAVGSSLAKPGETMRQWIDRHASRERIRHLLEAVTRVSTYTASVEEMDAAAALEQIRMAQEAGVVYISGGWQSLIEGLELRARQLGVTIRYGEPVKDIQGGTVLAIAPEGVETITGQHLETKPVRMACLNIGLRRLPQGSAMFALGLDQPFYYSVHSVAAKLADPGKAVIHVGKYLPSGAGSTREELEAFTEILAPGWKEEAEVVHYLPSMTVAHGLWGIAGRPGTDAVGRADIALAGDWVGPEGMLADAAVASGLRAAEAIRTAKGHAA